MKAIWAFDPRIGSEYISLWVSPDEYDYRLKHGGVVDGIRCTAVLDGCSRELNNFGQCFLRMRLERPWQPRLRLAVAA